jgi:hypothetical protein
VAPFSGMLALFEWPMTRRWTSWLPSSLCCTPLEPWWTPYKWKYDVRSFYKVLTCKKEAPFPWKNIWRTKVPLKVAFFAWSAGLWNILTLDNLSKRSVIVIDRCYMCKINGEFLDLLLLLYCEVPCALWNAIFSRFSLSWVSLFGWLIYSLAGGWVVTIGVLLCGRWFLLAFCGAYGMPSSAASVCLGLCLFGWLIYSLAGGWVVTIGVLLCGRWFPLAFCGACGGSEMIETLRTKKGILRSSQLSSFILCFLGLLCS